MFILQILGLASPVLPCSASRAPGNAWMEPIECKRIIPEIIFRFRGNSTTTWGALRCICTALYLQYITQFWSVSAKVYLHIPLESRRQSRGCCQINSTLIKEASNFLGFCKNIQKYFWTLSCISQSLGRKSSNFLFCIIIISFFLIVRQRGVSRASSGI